MPPSSKHGSGRHLRPCNGSWRVDETYIKVKGVSTYLYRAVDSLGQTIDFLLSAREMRLRPSCSSVRPWPSRTR